MYFDHRMKEGTANVSKAWTKGEGKYLNADQASLSGHAVSKRPRSGEAE